jgi:hypothetical protein
MSYNLETDEKKWEIGVVLSSAMGGISENFWSYMGANFSSLCCSGYD